MTAVPFPAPDFNGHPVVLLNHLRPLGVVEKQSEDYMPVVEYTDAQGRLVREVGDVTVLDNGRITAWPRSNVDDRGRVVVLRCAERAFTDGTEDEGWETRTTRDGVTYRSCTVLAYVTGAGGGLAASEEQTWSQRQAELIWDAMSRFDIAE